MRRNFHNNAAKSPTNVIVHFQAMEAMRRNQKFSPEIRDAYGILFTAITIIISAFSGLFSVLPILLLYGIWFSQLFVSGARLFAPMRDLIIPILLPLYAILSTVWSTKPEETLYLGVAFLSMVIVVIIISRTVSFAAFMQGICLGVVSVMFITVQSGVYANDFMSGTYSLVGYFGSKNIVGFFAQIGAMSALYLFFYNKGMWRKIAYALLPFALCLLCLYLSKSATSMISLILSFFAMALMALLGLVPNKIRMIFFVTVFSLSLFLLITLLQEGGVAFVLDLFGKDATLTGRTYLWGEGLKKGLENPLWGQGYSAFWQVGNLAAERLWNQFHILSRAGFHFHNGYIQTFVDLGVVGLILSVIIVLGNLFGSFWLVLRGEKPLDSMILFGFAVIFFLRSFTEVDFIGPFGAGVLMVNSLVLRRKQLGR